MKKLGISFAIIFFLIGVNTVNLHANPLPRTTAEIHRHEINELKSWWNSTYPNKPEPSFEEMQQQYTNTIKDWWNANYPNWPQTQYFGEMESDYRQYKLVVNKSWIGDRTASFSTKEQYYNNEQKKIYGKEIPFCLTNEERARLYQAKKYCVKQSHCNAIKQAEKINMQTAKKLGIKLQPVSIQSKDITIYLLFIGLLVAGISFGAGIILFRRKKNLPK